MLLKKVEAGTYADLQAVDLGGSPTDSGEVKSNIRRVAALWNFEPDIKKPWQLRRNLKFLRRWNGLQFSTTLHTK